MANDAPKKPVQTGDQQVKKAYVPPKLEQLGSFLDLTQGGVSQGLGDGF
jgi:hypothetical protein